MGIPFRTSKIIVLALALWYFFFLEDVSHKVKYVSEASYTCYLHFFFHISQPGRKMLLKTHQEVKCQMQLKDTSSEGFCVIGP